MEWSLGWISQGMFLELIFSLSITYSQDQKMEGLVVQLDNYSRLGIPKLHHLSVFPDPAEDQVEEGKFHKIGYFVLKTNR